jgi:hypothetical protein
LGSSPLSSSHHLVSSLSSSSLNSGASLNSHTHSGGALTHHSSLSHTSLSHTSLSHPSLTHSSALNQASPRSPTGAPAPLTPLPQDCLESYDDKAASAAAAWKNYQGFQNL